MKLGILTISDSIPLGKRTDLSGPRIRELIGCYFSETLYRVCTDDPGEISLAARDLLERADILITNGGTGMMPRDNTAEALKTLPGTPVRPLERAISAAMILSCGPLSAISTPVVLLVEGKYVIALPGKTEEVTAAIKDVIKPFLLHHILIDRVEIKGLVREFNSRESIQNK
jgi:molybdopterin adenylyltransferase